MGMGGNGNVESHSRTSLLYSMQMRLMTVLFVRYFLNGSSIRQKRSDLVAKSQDDVIKTKSRPCRAKHGVVLERKKSYRVDLKN